MERAGFRLIGVKMDKTYFEILPSDLRNLLALYYYDLMEIYVVGSFSLDPVEINIRLKIFIPDGHNTWRLSSMLMPISPTLLIENKNTPNFLYEKMPFSVILYDNVSKPKLVFSIMTLGASAEINLNEYYTDLFYKKLDSIMEHINKMKNKLRDPIVLQAGLSRSFVSKVF